MTSVDRHSLPILLSTVDPITHHQWDDLLIESGDHQVFHTSAWAKVLKESYGYIPLYFTHFEGERLALLLPIAEVVSSFTGRRGVSLPFSDHCPPYIRKGIVPSGITEQIIEYGRNAKWRYLEFRGGECLFPDQPPTEVFYTHELNLFKSEEELISGLKPSTRRNIKKSSESGLTIEIDDSLESITKFFRLNCLTRKRLGYPSQPFKFFRKLHEHVISQGYGIVVSAFLANKCVASSVFLYFGNQALFKFGSSDYQYQHLRPNNLVMWEAIQWLKDRGYETLNFGRTNIDDDGLRRYKQSWGTREKEIPYFVFNLTTNAFASKAQSVRHHRKLLRILPIPLLRLIGRALYKHVA